MKTMIKDKNYIAQPIFMYLEKPNQQPRDGSASTMLVFVLRGERLGFGCSTTLLRTERLSEEVLDFLSKRPALIDASLLGDTCLIILFPGLLSVERTDYLRSLVIGSLL
jgi:hypothetical protein